MDVFSPIPTFFLILFTTCIIVIYWFTSQRYKYWKKRNIPYAKPAPLVGNLGFLMRRSATEFFIDMSKKFKNDYLGIYLGLQPALLVQSPELAKQVLVKDYKFFQDRYLYSPRDSDPLGSLNLFTVKNPLWSGMRKELIPMFTSARLKKVCELMNINATELVKKIKREHINDDSINLKEIFSMYTSDTVAFTVFGLRMSALNGEDSPLWYITRHMVKWTFWRGLEFSMIFFVPLVASLMRMKFFSAAATDYIKKLFWSVVSQRKDITTQDSKDLMNHLLKLKENMQLPVGADPGMIDDLMLANVAVFILGSIETSSSTLCYILHELSYHPDEQEKLYNEVNDALMQKGKDVLEYHDLLELKYLNACIFETMRKYPPVPYLDRICGETYKLNDEVTIEKGIPVLVNVCALHYDETMYPEPEKWRPERVLPVSDNDNLQFNFLPFGEGPRYCIGKRYGTLQVRAALAQMIHKFRIEPGFLPYNIRTDPYSLITSPENGGNVKFILRNQ